MLSPKEVVKKWVDAFNAGDVDMIVSLYDNNATNHQVIVERAKVADMGDTKKTARGYDRNAWIFEALN